MTRTEGMAQMDRYVHAGYRQPEDISAAFDEWFTLFASSDVDDVAAAIGRMVSNRTSSFWPTPGELSEHLRAVVAGRIATDEKCATCHGSGWIDAPPYRANGGRVYHGVMRCHACGIPPPNMQHMAGMQTPLAPGELRAWANEMSREGDVLTKSEFLARCAGITARMRMPKARVDGEVA
jgi:hypothetical protein